MTERRRAPLEVLERLAEALDLWAGGVSFYPNSSEPGKPLHEAVCRALAAYRAATAPLRTETAVVLDIGHHVRACVRLGELRMTADEKQRLEDLANEHTAPVPEKPPLRVHDLRATFSGSVSDEPEACSCDESEGLKRELRGCQASLASRTCEAKDACQKLLDIRTEYELWETCVKGSSATLSAIALILRGEP
jgi:hypothetical protein